MTTSIKTLRNQTIALAGLTQAVYLVQQIAKVGTADQAAIETSIRSVLKIDAERVEDVYGGLAGLAVGLKQLLKQVGGKGTMDAELARYSATLVFLESKLEQRPQMLRDIRTGIETAAAQAEHSSVVHENVLTKLADLYHQTLSTMSPRVVINGEQTHLTDPHNIHLIRALLLAGIRAVVLWRHCGGSRWKLLLFRNHLLAETRKLLQEL